MNDLAERFDATWIRFRAAVDDLGDAKMEFPTRVGWTAKEMLGHLGFWLEATEGVIVGTFRGEPLRDDFAFESGYVPDPDAPWPTADVHNAREASWARSRSAAEVVARLDAGHAVFTSLLESLRADEFTHDRYPELRRPHVRRVRRTPRGAPRPALDRVKRDEPGDQGR